ncbi:GNAT family N-acetyltransferase [Fodinibacter luteus]|uniref:GNAT family N-acetyltransferase n=1 Tax=Fodinibacter luteus TaxID=552064 RepID=A0ABP8KNL3_9MICO
MSPPTIRRVLPDELDAVGRLTVDAYVGGGVIPADAPYLEFLGDAAHRDAEAELWVAVDERGVVGTVTFVGPGSRLREVALDDEAEIRTLAVAPAAGGEGIGEALTRHTIELARARGFGALVLSSSTSMHAAHRLYERLGFTRLPERDWSPVAGVQLVAYTLPL